MSNYRIQITSLSTSEVNHISSNLKTGELRSTCESLFDPEGKNLHGISRYPWRPVIIIFCIGLILKSTVYWEPHFEVDEFIYIALVQQLDSGRGYTLQGHPIVEEGALDPIQYNRPVFFHPPGGPGLFWMFHRMFGDSGYPLVQIFSFILFYASLMLMGQTLGCGENKWSIIVLALLGAFNPIMSHVVTNYWLDGPLLAFCTLSVALFLMSIVRGPIWIALIAGMILGYASLIKVTAFLVVPGALLLAMLAKRSKDSESLVKPMLYFLVVAVLIQLPWEFYLWITYGNAFPEWAGKPSASLVASNSYVHFLTVIRTPWTYLSLVPRILWTLVPGLILWILLWPHPRIRKLGMALLIWIAIVLTFHMILGALGYSKVVRYVILLVPAAIVLFTTTFGQALRLAHRGDLLPGGRIIAWFVLAICILALAMEITTGITCSFRTKHDLIMPFFGPQL